MKRKICPEQVYSQRFNQQTSTIFLPPFLLVFLLFMTGCGGASDSNQVTVKNTPEPVNSNIIIAEQEYILVDFPDSQQLALHAYWPENTEIPTEILTSLQALLPQVEQLFSEQHFAFVNSSSENNTDLLKQLIFTPLANIDDHLSLTNKAKFQLDEDGYLHISFLVDDLPSSDDLLQPLISLIYQSERSKYQIDDSFFQKIVTQGLALHFVESVLIDSTLYKSIELAPDKLTDALSQLSLAKVSNEVIDDWFIRDGLAWPVSHYLVQQHLSFHPGSDASNSFALDAALFSPWVSGADDSLKKIEQYVRTDDVANQIEVSELTRQANEFIGSYFLEGYNHEKLIALTFDDGPSQYTEQILTVFEQAEIKASFFWQGANLLAYQPIVERTLSAGHTLANHSWNHENGMNYTPEQLWQLQVEKTNQQFQQSVGIIPRFYRPPYGEITDEQVAFLSERKMKVILWSVDSRDWNPDLNSVEQIESEIINHQHPEVITLMHDSGGNRQNTVDALPAIIKHYQEQGYRFVTLEHMLGISDKF